MSASPLMTRKESSRSARLGVLHRARGARAASPRWRTTGACRARRRRRSRCGPGWRGTGRSRPSRRSRAACSSRSTCSMIGRLTTGSSGLGWLAVIGRSRVPSPPAIDHRPHGAARRPAPGPRTGPAQRRTCQAYARPATQYRTVPHVDERPAQRPEDRGQQVVALGQRGEQHGEGVQQVEGRGLAQEGDRQRAVAVAAQHRQQAGEEHVPGDERDREDRPGDRRGRPGRPAWRGCRGGPRAGRAAAPAGWTSRRHGRSCRRRSRWRPRP